MTQDHRKLIQSLQRHLFAVMLGCTALFMLTAIGCSQREAKICPDGAIAGTGTVFGMARNNIEVFEGATVQILVGNAVLAESVVGHGGAFTASLSPYIPSGAYTVEITLADGEVYRTKVQTFKDEGFVHVNALTNLIAVYLDRHQNIPVEEARRRVHVFLGIPKKADLGDQVMNPQFAQFSSTDFNATALKYPEGRQAYYEKVADGVVAHNPLAGNSTPLGWTHGEGYENGAMYYWGEDNDPVFASSVTSILSSTVNQGIAASETVTKGVSESLMGELGSKMGDALIDNVVHICINHIPGLGDSPTLDEILTGISTIEGQLNNIEKMLTSLASFISAEFNQANYNILASGISGDITNITTLYGHLERINYYSSMSPVDTTDLATHLAALNKNMTPDIVYDNAMNIANAQFDSADPLKSQMYLLARSITLADTFIGNAPSGPIANLQNQVNYYASLQAEAVGVLQALAAPYMASDGTVNFYDTPAGNQSLVTGYNNDITNNIQEVMSALPYGSPTDDVIFCVKDNVVFTQASIDQGTAGNNWTYAGSYTSGGIEAGGWRVADTNSIQNYLYSRIQPSMTDGGTDGDTDGASYVVALNQNIGFNLKPGEVTYHKTGSKSKDTIVATNHGFLTVLYDTTMQLLTVGWINDDGTKGTIGSCYEFNPANISNDLYNTDQSNWVINDNTGYAFGEFDGPVILMANPSTGNVDPNNIASASYGLYNGFTFTVGKVQYDPYSNNSSAVQMLAVNPTFPNGKTSTYVMNNEVYFTSSDPDNAPISNVVPPDPDGGLDGSVPDASEGPITTPALMAGMIHWLPGASGESVTFTATRYLPNGTLVGPPNYQVSTVLVGPSLSDFQSSAQPDAIEVWPSSFVIYPENFTSDGVKLYVSRHFGVGTFSDVATDSRPNVTYESSDPSVSVNPLGLVKSSQDLDAGTVVTITIIDPLVPTGKTDTRPSVTATINLIAE